MQVRLFQRHSPVKNVQHMQVRAHVLLTGKANQFGYEPVFIHCFIFRQLKNKTLYIQKHPFSVSFT